MPCMCICTYKQTDRECAYCSAYAFSCTLPEGEAGRLTMAGSNRRMVPDLERDWKRERRGEVHVHN